ncbi:glycosyltransferase [Shewanella algae]|uniref:glycosyltransferase n=2 Tax=Shewanella algae TaxID=38313 RepID=UPI001AAF2432|nr:glycosyltransferase [Shewanella algae]
MMTAHNIKVSVCVVTYNQKSLVRECLESIVNQSTDFNFEVIVSDDGSTDGTQDVIQEYANNYDFIVPVIGGANKGALKNYIETHKLARGEYVCHCDGDDLFLPGKLQSQVNFLDANPNYSISAHAVRVIGSNEIFGNAPHLPVTATASDLVTLGTYFVHSSVMYRRSCRPVYEDGFESVDFYVHLQTALDGLIHLNKSVLGYYRKHAGGITSNNAYREKIEKIYNSAYDMAIDNGIEFSVAKKAKVKRNFAFALSRYFDGDTEGFVKIISLEKEDYPYSSQVHRLLYHTRNIPLVMFCLNKLRNFKKIIIRSN